MSSTRTLIVLRHAKSAWGLDLDDHDRPLSKRGRRDAEAVGAFLAERKLAADLVWCSTAVRARETWLHAEVGGARSTQVRHDERIYEAVVAELVTLLRTTPDEARTVILLGHAPAVPDLVEELAPRNGKDKAWNQMDTKYPTSGIAVLNFDGDWDELKRGRAELESFDIPRGPKPGDVTSGKNAQATKGKQKNLKPAKIKNSKIKNSKIKNGKKAKAGSK